MEAHFSLGISSTFDSVLVVSTIIKLLFFLRSLLPNLRRLASNDEELMFLVTSKEENY